MANTERAPRPGTNAALVYPFLKEGRNRWEARLFSGLSGSAFRKAIRHNYKFKYVEKPGPISGDDLKRIHRETTSAARGAVWLMIAPYEPLLLTAKQTQVALRIFDQREFSLGQITKTYGRERRRHNLGRPVKELSDEAQRDKRRSEKELLEIVRTRMAVRDLLERNDLTMPRAVVEWQLLSTLFQFAQKFVASDQAESFLVSKVKERYDHGNTTANGN